MVSSLIQYSLQLIIMIFLFNIIFAEIESPYERRYASDLSNKRYLGKSFKYAWFTRDIHDEDNVQRMELLKEIFNRKYRDFI
jgi:hypothetical protein